MMETFFLAPSKFEQVWLSMKAWAAQPQVDEALLLCEHESVYTLGQAAPLAHVLDSGQTPVVRCDRGGQVTYHGPGQVVAYPLIDLRARALSVKEYVFLLEGAVIAALADLGVTGHRVGGAPGVFINRSCPFGHDLLPQRPLVRAPHSPPVTPDFTGVAKIAALGLKITHGRAYHGIALNVAMDLNVFSGIVACGSPALAVTDLKSLGLPLTWRDGAQLVAAHLLRRLSPP